jgi:hypothetical protein
LVIDYDMAFGINLVGVDAEFGFDVDGHTRFNEPMNQCAKAMHQCVIWIIGSLDNWLITLYAQ